LCFGREIVLRVCIAVVLVVVVDVDVDVDKQRSGGACDLYSDKLGQAEASSLKVVKLGRCN
jgi:hypothetical protein